MKLSHVVMAFALIVALVVMPGCASTPDDQDPTQLASTPTPSVSTPPSKDELYAQAKTLFLDRWIAAISEFFSVLFS